MWDVNQIYSFLRWLVKRNQAGGISATDFFYAWNSEQRAYQSDLLGRFQAQSNGKSGINTGLIENRTLLQKLSPFTKTAPLVIAAGVVNKPDDFIYELAIRIGNFEVIHITKGEIPAVQNSVIDAPSVADNKYYVTEYEETYSFLPTTVTAAALDYICDPTDIVWGNTIVDGRQVYDAGASVQPVWHNDSIIEITRRCLKSLGVHFHDGDFANFGNSQIITGN